MPIKKDGLLPPKNLVPATFDKLPLLFSKKVNLVFFCHDAEALCFEYDNDT